MTNKRGFTLAEVLIVLVILGVVAAMTIPTLMNNINSAQFKTGIKKAFNALNQAVGIATAGADMDQSTTNQMQEIMELFTSNMRVTSMDITNGSFWTADGFAYWIEDESNLSDCAMTAPTDVGEVEAGSGKACAKITIDVNGLVKGPNTVSDSTGGKTGIRDRFEVFLYGREVAADENTQYYIFENSK